MTQERCPSSGMEYQYLASMNTEQTHQTITSENGNPLIERWTTAPAKEMGNQPHGVVIGNAESETKEDPTNGIADESTDEDLGETVGECSNTAADEPSDSQSIQEFLGDAKNRIARSMQQKAEQRQTLTAVHASSEDGERSERLQADSTWPVLRVRMLRMQPYPHFPSGSKFKLKRPLRDRSYDHVYETDMNGQSTDDINDNTVSEYKNTGDAVASEDSCSFEGDRYVENVSDAASVTGNIRTTNVQIDSTRIADAPNKDAPLYGSELLNAMESRGKFVNFPPDVLDKLHTKIETEIEPRHQPDQHHQHELLTAKVNATEADRERGIPTHVLYPGYVDEDAEVEFEPFMGEYEIIDEESFPSALPKEQHVSVPPSDLFGQYFENNVDNGLDGNYDLDEQTERGKDILSGYYVVDPQNPGQVVLDSPNGKALVPLPGWLDNVYSGFGKFFVSKPKHKKGNRAKTGWTLEHLLEDIDT